MLSGYVWAHGFFEGEGWRINARYTGKTSLKELVAVANSSCYQPYGDTSGMTQDAHRQFSHQRLTVG